MLRRGAERLLAGFVRQGAATAATSQQVRELKRSTYLTGLAVDEDAETNTINLLNELLFRSKEKLPEESAYRKSVESYCNKFLACIKESESQEAAEDKLDRQYEQVIGDCLQELELLDLMAVWKPWQYAADHDIRVFADLKDLPANVKSFRDFQAQIASRQ